ncbi:MobA/MobL family protein [Haemophilus haemolyticus]|uniref:MobA/MobL family protein n=1 Tax=Haemophilus haemolyticus TaxID=726 RepID=UPI000E598615|nr:MobA/MobL family protein [Haemophilus haemolyticus]
MALFHLESKIHSKKPGSDGKPSKSVSAIVAYRHCFQMGDYDYSRKAGLVTSFLLAPENLDPSVKSALENADPRIVWDAVDKVEKRKDAQLCQELIISLQHELSLEENIKNLKTLLNDNFTKKGFLVDVCVHNSKENGNENENLHAHVIFSQRTINNVSLIPDLTPEMVKTGFNPENIPMKVADVEFGKKVRDQEFYTNGVKVDQISDLREQWANLCNNSFKEANIDAEISAKSLKAQREIALEKGDFQLAAELDRKPVQHIHHTRQNEEELRIKVEQTLRRNEQIKAMNQAAIDLELDKTPGYEPTPLLEMPPRTFKEQIKIRKEARIKEIIKNVTRFIENRANKYSPILSQARARAASIVSSVSNAIRNKKYGMVVEIVRNNNLSTEIDVGIAEEIGKLDRRELENSRRNQENVQVKETQQLLLEVDKEIENNKEEISGLTLILATSQKIRGKYVKR